jgi:hypothetical protein
MAAREGAAQVSKARPVYVFCAGQVVAAMELCAARPAPATTAAPATPQLMYLRFFDCRWLDLDDLDDLNDMDDMEYPTPGCAVHG